VAFSCGHFFNAAWLKNDQLGKFKFGRHPIRCTHQVTCRACAQKMGTTIRPLTSACNSWVLSTELKKYWRECTASKSEAKIMAWIHSNPRHWFLIFIGAPLTRTNFEPTKDLFWRKYFGFCKGFFGFLPFLTF
jgi:hypothetical protein